MKDSVKLQLLLVLFLCAVTVLWLQRPYPQADPSTRVDGIYFGMTRADVESRSDDSRYAHTRVTYDSREQVISVTGVVLEINGVDLTPKSDDDSSCRRLEAALGKPDLVSPEEFSFSYSSRYLEQNLTVDIGCMGYTFVLGDDARTSRFVPYEEDCDPEGHEVSEMETDCPYCPLPDCPGGVLKMAPVGGHSHPCSYGCVPCPNDRGGLYAKMHGIYGE